MATIVVSHSGEAGDEQLAKDVVAIVEGAGFDAVAKAFAPGDPNSLHEADAVIVLALEGGGTGPNGRIAVLTAALDVDKPTLVVQRRGAQLAPRVKRTDRIEVEVAGAE